jgi:transposase-like protein
VRLSQRSRIILLAAAGKENAQIALEVGVTPNLVGRWRARFAEQRIAGIEKDAPRSGRRPIRRQQLAEKIIAKTTKEKPADATHWSVRSLSAVLGCSRAMVNRVWRAAGLKPHLCRTFKVSNDPRFTEKLLDVVGLYTARG